MEVFDDDDFSDLYADVEVQASSAISALHRSTEIPPRNGSISATAARGEKKAANGIGGAEIDGGNRKFHERDAAREEAEEDKGGGGGFGLRNLPVENGVRCGRRSGSGSGSESEDGIERKNCESSDSEKYDDRASDIEVGEIARKEKSVNGGDYSSQRKYNSVNAKKRVDDMVQQVRRTCRSGDADDRDPFSSRAREDNQPFSVHKLGGPEIASERHTQAWYPVPSDLDKHGSVQISDSVEDSSREMSECDSEGMSETSDDTNRRKANCISNKVSSALKPDTSESGGSQHGRGYSCSPSRAALSSRYFEKSHNRSIYSSSSLRCELREPMTLEYRPPKHFDSHGVKQGTREGRYSERWRDSIRERSNQPKKSNYIAYFKNRPDEDAYAIDSRQLCNRHVNHGKQRAMVAFKYNESDIPNCSDSERILTYSGGRWPDHHLGPAFLKDQCWDIPNHRYIAGHPDGHNMSERQNFIDKKSSQMYHEAFEYNRYHNQRRHPFQGDIERLRNLSPKYSSAVDRRGTQFKREDIHLRRRTRHDYLSPVIDYDGRFVEGKYRRIHPNSGGDRDHLDGRFDQNVAHDRREVESSGRGKRRYHSPLNSSKNICYIETDVNDRRNIKHQPFPFYSSEEPNGSGRGEFVGASGRKSGVAQRNMRRSWKEMRIEYDQYGTDVATFVTRESLRYHPPMDYHVRRRDYQQSSNTYVTRESIKDDQYQDHFVGRRHYQHSEVLHPREDVNKSRQLDDSVFSSEEPSYNFRRLSKDDEADDRPAVCRVTELNERETGRQNSNMLREEDNSNHFDGCRKSTKHHSHAQMHPSHQDSVDSLVVEGRKCSLQSSIRRITEAGEDTYYGRRDLVGANDKKEPNNFKDSDEFNPEKTVSTGAGKLNASLSDRNEQSKFSKNQQNNFLDIEEGQIVTEEIQNAAQCTRASEDGSQMNATGNPETASNGNGVVERLDDEKIRLIMMKMERRRERFKEMIPTSRDCEKISCPLPNPNVETGEARLERPARKRRWLGT
ncbi:hypothetical protein C2S52_014388 [Perilla frutescens var. hirtella]|nr:hypothetical protein C2S52_014388 [Perilla frutescens var. hirtella]